MPNQRKEGKKCFSAWIPEEILEELKRHVQESARYNDFTEFVETAITERYEKDKRQNTPPPQSP